MLLRLIDWYSDGDDERTRRCRRTIVRYILLAYILALIRVSTPVKKRFPTMQHIIAAGLMTEAELVAFDAIKSPYAKHWLPIRWALQVVTTARMEKRIASEFLYDRIVDVSATNLLIYATPARHGVPWPAR